MQLRLLAKTLDDIRHQNGEEFWYARDLFEILGYKRWEGFKGVLKRAMDSVQSTGLNVDNHFRQVTKKVQLGSGAERELEDFKLTRYACYIVTQNGDPRIAEIAFAQQYFAQQTRKQELLEQSAKDIERLVARDKLKEAEKEFGQTVMTRDVDSSGLAEIRDEGDRQLFGRGTSAMKRRVGAKGYEPLADYLDDVNLTAKELATKMTTRNTVDNELIGKEPIKQEHAQNNAGVRGTLKSRGIIPEDQPPVEDLKKVARRHKKQLNVLPTSHTDSGVLDDSGQEN